MSELFAAAWAKTSSLEKGYVNDPADPGGETNHGITVKVARAAGYQGEMRDLPAEMALQIARHEYWDRLRLDEIGAISPAIAFELFDTNLNMWTGAAVGWLQTALNALSHQPATQDIRIDGLVGTLTIARLAAYIQERGPNGELVMLRCLNSLQCADYIRQANAIDTKRRFVFGWVLKRVYIETPSTV